MVMNAAKKKYVCFRSTLTFFMPKTKIDRQNRLRFRLQQFSSFPCTFDRCLEPNTLYCMSNN
jgi:hypothetical protein